MNFFIYPSIFSLLLISVSSFFLFKKIYAKGRNSKENKYFSFCWLTISIIFFLIGLRNVFFNYGLMSIDRCVAYIIQAFVAVVFMSFAHYIFYITIKNSKIRYILLFLFLISALIFLFLLFFLGLSDPVLSEWGSEYTAPIWANLFLFFVVSIGLLFLLYFVFTQTYILLFKKQKINKNRYYSTLSLLLFILMSMIEQAGAVAWRVLLLRILILSNILLIYLLFTNEEFEKV